jgi:protein ImuB
MTLPRVVAIHLPRFVIQRRLREDDSLAHRPLAVVRSSDGACTVVSASRAALIRGVMLGSTAAEARAVCPGVKLLPDAPSEDLRALEGLAEALLLGCSAVELYGPEGILCDASSPVALRASRDEGFLIALLARRCRVLGYRAHLVLADGKFGAMALAVHRPYPAIVRGPLQNALAPLPLSALPVSEKSLWALRALGMKTLGELSALPPAGLVARFGADGSFWQRLARGDDSRPLVPLRPAPPLV